MSSIFVFGVRALDCNIRVETGCREAYDMLLRYIFPPLSKNENPVRPSAHPCLRRKTLRGVSDIGRRCKGRNSSRRNGCSAR